jgi:hypothetical protein
MLVDIHFDNLKVKIMEDNSGGHARRYYSSRIANTQESNKILFEASMGA